MIILLNGKSMTKSGICALIYIKYIKCRKWGNQFYIYQYYHHDHAAENLTIKENWSFVIYNNPPQYVIFGTCGHSARWTGKNSPQLLEPKVWLIITLFKNSLSFAMIRHYDKTPCILGDYTTYEFEHLKHILETNTF